MSDYSITRFSTYEAVRIFIPGFYFTFLLVLTLGLWTSQWEIVHYPAFFTLCFTTIAVIAGITIYAKETPKKRKAFKENLPSAFLLERSRQKSPHPLTEADARKLYFYILNQHMPDRMHDKIFYFGMVYHIMINIRRTTFWYGIVSFGACILQFTTRGSITLEGVLFTSILWLFYALNVAFNKADRKMQENYSDQIFWLEMHQELVDSLIVQRHTVIAK